MGELTYRDNLLTVRDATDGEAPLSFDATIATEQPVAVYDGKSRRVVDEVLVASGGSFPGTMPLLDSHNRKRSSDVLGSATNFRQRDNEWVGQANFDADDTDAVKVANKVRNGHVRSVSIGYTVSRWVDIPPNQTRTVDGRKYTAGKRALRVSQEWQGRELSVTPIGADSRATFRDCADVTTRENTMNPRLRTYLDHCGLDSSAEDSAARDFLADLRGNQRTIANCLDYDAADDTAATTCDLAIRSLGYDPAEPWNFREAEATETEDTASEDKPDAQEMVRQALADERSRVHQIRAAGRTVVPDEMIERAIEDNLSLEESQQRFLQHLRHARGNGDNGRDDAAENKLGYRSQVAILTGQSPAGQEQGNRISPLSLAFGMMARNGVDAEQFTTVQGTQPVKHDTLTDELQREAENGYHLRGLSLIDVCRSVLELETGHRSWHGADDVIEALRSSPSAGSAVSGIFTTTFSAELIAGYEAATDTTGPWTSEGTLPNFQTSERHRMVKGSPLTKHARGGEAEHTDRSSQVESYKLARYSGQFVIDDMDIIDDRFGALASESPRDMGEAARMLRPDLVYSILFANANMSDGNPLFDDTNHGNANTTAALATGTIEAAINDLNVMTEGGRPLSKSGIVFVVPENLSFLMDRLIESPSRSQDSDVGVRNPLLTRNLNYVADARLDNGVTDPNSGTVHAGVNTTWYAASVGRHTIEVGYLRGRGRNPSLRSFVLTQGRWGIGWDVYLDIGAKALDWKGLVRNVA